MSQETLIEVNGLSKAYPIRKLLQKIGEVQALDDVSFSVEKGETLAVVGESGCGKTTLAKLLMRIEPPTSGGFKIAGQDSESIPREKFLHHLQMIFQDPYGSINPRKKAWQIIAEPLLINSSLSQEDCRKKAVAAMIKVGLRPEQADRFPHMFSGGQRQRIGIARALMMEPKVVICDEPVSALDVSVQAQVLNLLMDLQEEMDLSYIFISHDLSVVRHIADRVMVIYLGQIAEIGKKEQIFSDPRHPYTKILLKSTPKIGVSREERSGLIAGDLPSPINRPSGCAFQQRCPFAVQKCREEVPQLTSVNGRDVSCFRAEEDLT